MNRLSLTRVRRPDPALLEELAAHDREAFGPTGLRTYDLAVTAEAGAVFVARQDGRLVGGCQLLRVLDEPTFFYLVGFYVLPAYRKKGLGRELLALLSEESRRLGAEGLLLTVSPDNLAGLKLYRSAGFAEEALVMDFYGRGEDRFILRKVFEETGLRGGVS